MRKVGKVFIIGILTTALVTLNSSEDRIKQIIIDNNSVDVSGGIVEVGQELVLVSNNDNKLFNELGLETQDESEKIDSEEEVIKNINTEETQVEETIVFDTAINNESQAEEIQEADTVLEEVSKESSEVYVSNNEEDVESKEEVVENEPQSKFITVGKNTSGQEYDDGKITINNGGGFEISEQLLATTYSTIANTNKKVSFYITDPESNMTISYNAHMDMEPASSVKAGGALLACKMVDAGELNFDTEYEYTSNYYNDGSGTIKLDRYGTKYTLRDLVHRCVHESDNIAYAMILDIIGKDNYNNMILELGGTHTLTSWQRYGLHSAQDLNLVWQEIYNSDRVAGEEIYAKKQAGEIVDETKYSACAILNFEFLDAKYNFLQNSITYPSSHKSGFSGGSYNDSGVVYTDTGKLIVTIMTNGESYLNAQRFNSVASCVNEMIGEYCNYKANTNNISEEIEME